MERVILNEYCSINSFKEDKKSNLVTIEGYACHFNVANKNGEIVHEDSFTECLAEFKKEGRMPIMNYNHNPEYLIGGWDEITVHKEGLYVKGHLNKDVALVRDTVLPLIKSGDLSGLSTEGFTCFKDIEEDEKGNLRLNKFFLMGIAIVAMPADPKADVSIRNQWEKEKKEKIEKKEEENQSLKGRGVNIVYHF